MKKDEWIQHDGQRIPAGLDHNQRVEVEYRDGETDTGMVSAFHWVHDHDPAGNPGADILRYRLGKR